MQPKQDYFKNQSVSRETIERLRLYQELLVKWQKAINLVSSKTLTQSWERHFADSAQLAPLVPQNIKIIADLGSGAGFPGLVLAILKPELEAHLVESDMKKCQFLKTVSRETGAKVIIHNARVEDVYEKISPDLVTARALAPLGGLLELCWPWAENNKDMSMLFLKGAEINAEIKKAEQKYKFTYKTYPSYTDPQARILHTQFS